MSHQHPGPAPDTSTSTSPAVTDSERFRCLFDRHPAAVLLLDAQGRIVDANSVLHTRFGHEPAALRGQSLSVLLPDWDQPGLLADLIQCGEQVDAVLRHAQGQRCEVLVCLVPTAPQQKAEAPGCFLIARDVTAQRRLQRQLQVQSEILARLHEAVLVLDDQGDVLCCNPSAARLYSVVATTLCGQPLAALFEAPESTRLQQGLAEMRFGDRARLSLELSRSGPQGQQMRLRLLLSRLDGVEPGRELCLVQCQDVAPRCPTEIAVCGAESGQ